MLSKSRRIDFRKIVREGYEKGNYARLFREGHVLSTLETKFLDSLVIQLADRATLLDLGCGIGTPYDRYLADKGFQVTGILTLQASTLSGRGKRSPTLPM